MGSDLSRSPPAPCPPVPFGISYNGQDFYPPAPIPGAAAIADFMYGLPVVSSVLPRSGVAAAQIQIRGGFGDERDHWNHLSADIYLSLCLPLSTLLRAPI